jgi:hypothetical protein
VWDLRGKALGTGLLAICGKLLDFPLRFPARHGFGVARAGVEDHFPEPPRFGLVTPFLGQGALGVRGS